MTETSTDHASAAGALCTDDGTGCCSTCGVSLTSCEECSGVGYHKAECPGERVQWGAMDDAAAISRVARGRPHSEVMLTTIDLSPDDTVVVDVDLVEPEVTAKTVKNSQIREEYRADGTTLDRLMVAIYSDDHELRMCARAEFAAAINARAKAARRG